MNVIEIKNLTKTYGKSRGISDISFNVEQGEIFGFIGPNGAGKSTTIRTLLSLIYPTSGSATIFGKDCIRFAPEIKKEIGYLPSEVFYYDNMKVKELLNYSASFYKKDCSKRIKDLAKIMDLDLNKKIDDLSLGNKKKVGIVQGLLHEPKLIILDEPTSGLDPLMQQKFFELLEEENKKGATILFSSHILSEVQRLCNRVAIIKEGKIVTVEKISTLQENNYKKFKIETKSALDKNYFQIGGVNKLEVNNNVISFLFRGNINTVMKRIAEIEIANLWIEEPDLEEIFMHYYEKEA
ncbi:MULTISPECIES: ABC transporter ATP-binding protein [unclassified Peribacillus]|uniref:ABC transporter ATP-binding protein n=1 Tax=unclassified Peribacillus TaxID=2675266 RepID=UPI0019136626|nr:MULTISPECIES: ABC transporter ATP-binding protein [unclassified Peribacillus]MBK5441632.1 ABC transporter ATP-binding protein [Peribacillus sp. TH24]MBK5483036.1 ABC transporter ATP-binding protein [Peribacillus sp. TH16]MBK5501849.1 ABC transporter ATP-binding protein [Peribacillus sp. TH14]WMX53224.1 ABC transporter ATP-binding protein [Peribacillus sp. R9-11]